jgi:N-acetylglutamate synthase-like GNAT family acetyltransferase
VPSRDGVSVGPLEPTASKDAALVEQLAELINDVYVNAESGLWRDDATRTTTSEIADFIAARQIVVAKREGRIVGAVRLHDVAEDLSEFGLLVAAQDERGTGVGRALLDFAEEDSRARGLRAMQLELLLPRTWLHPSKEFLKSWYGRRGYRLVRTGTLDEDYPHLAPLLAVPCDLAIYEKAL